MSENIELSTLDLRYEGYRLRDDAREARLRASIAERGIEKPLEGVDTPEARILLQGFKRYRSAKKLGIQVVPYVSLGDEEATANLNAMNKIGPHPWQLSFSYGRALQAPVQKTWLGKPENVDAAKHAYFHRAKLNSAATLGDYTPEMEQAAA